MTEGGVAPPEGDRSGRWSIPGGKFWCRSIAFNAFLASTSLSGGMHWGGKRPGRCPATAAKPAAPSITALRKAGSFADWSDRSANTERTMPIAEFKSLPTSCPPPLPGREPKDIGGEPPSAGSVPGEPSCGGGGGGGGCRHGAEALSPDGCRTGGAEGKGQWICSARTEVAEAGELCQKCAAVAGGAGGRGYSA